MPSDFNMPKSPFSTAMNTDRKCSRSDLEVEEEVVEVENSITRIRGTL